jgi:SAM-dependent methyltransferase/uncharacterized protein YbaR (Trm112 family)
MIRALADLLRCPCCKARLALHPIADADADIRDGFLECAACRVLYPIIRGVPRMIRNAFEDYRDFYYRHQGAIALISGQEEIAGRIGRLSPSVFDRRSNESFSFQWSVYQYQDRTWFKDDLDLRKQEFLYNMDLQAEQLRGALLLDAGCGNGRLTASLAGYGAEVIGMDLSRSVERAAENVRAFANGTSGAAGRVHFVQGNILEPPFAESTFDHIHTSGVLHHTPDPERALHSFLSLGKPGGRAYVQMYRRREAWVRIVNGVLRTVTCRLPVPLLYQICYAMVPAHTRLIELVAWARGEETPIANASRRERAVSMFDHFSPRYQFRYTAEQLHAMLEQAGLHDLKDVTLANEARHMVAFVGVR